MTTIDTAPLTTDRRIRRLPERQSFDRAQLHRLLDEQLVGHLAATHHGAPIVVPMAFARVGDDVLLHGSTGGGFALRAAAEHTPVAFAVTSLDALVVARSLYDHSMNYRSAIVYGVLEEVDDEASALDLLADKLLPGRAAEVRANTRKELAATRVLRLALDDVVMKMRAAGAGESADDGEDHTTWAGIVPLAQTWGEPVASVLTPAGTPAPDSVRALTTRDGHPPRL